MKRITSTILTCLMLGGVNSTRAADAPPGPTYERWKSCVDLFHPKGLASVSDLQVPIAQPTNIRELLQNLQFVWKQHLLFEPSFYDPTTLRKLFAASAMSWGEPLHPLTADVGFVVAQLDSGVLPEVRVRVESRCWHTDIKSDAGQVHSTAYIVNNLSLSGKAFPGMDLHTIRAVFGPETVNVIEAAEVEFGIVHAPVGKGHVAYADQAREKAEGGLAQRITFFFDLSPSQQTPEQLTKIIDEDVVEHMEMDASRHLQLEK